LVWRKGAKEILASADATARPEARNEHRNTMVDKPADIVLVMKRVLDARGPTIVGDRVDDRGHHELFEVPDESRSHQRHICDGRLSSHE